MATSILLILQANQQVSWALFDGKKQIRARAVNVPLDATLPVKNARVIVLIPGVDVLLTQADIPTRQRQRIVQAVPYALEDQLAEEIDKLHFAVGERDAQSGHIAVAVLSHTHMQTYLQRLQAVGITADVLAPDVLAVPKPSDGWGILSLQNKLLVRTSVQSGFAIEPECINIVLPLILQEHSQHPPQQIVVFSNANESNPLSQLAVSGIPIVENQQESVLDCLVQGLSETNCLNLLQGNYRPMDKLVSLWYPWRLTAALLIAWGILYLGMQGVEYQQLQQQYQTLLTQTEKVYLDAFPEARKVVNARVQMEQQLKTLRAAQSGQSQRHDDFLTLLTQLSTPLKQTPGLGVKHIDYRQGVIDIELVVLNLQALEQLKQRLVALGLTIEIQSATSRRESVESRLQIRKS